MIQFQFEIFPDTSVFYQSDRFRLKMDQGCLPAQIRFLTNHFEVNQNYFLNQKRARLTHESCDMTSLTYKNGSNLPGPNTISLLRLYYQLKIVAQWYYTICQAFRYDSYHLSKPFQIRWRGQSATSSKYFSVISMGDRPRPPPSAHIGEF